jgi:hypothetical protein
MKKIDIMRTLLDCKLKLIEASDLWDQVPMEIRDELERLFVEDQGVGYHIYRSLENLDEIKGKDIDEAFKECDSRGSRERYF